MTTFVDEPLPYRSGSIAWLIDRYIQDTASAEMKAIGPSKLYTLRVIQRSALGDKSATALKKNDVIDYCRELRRHLSASTVNQYLCFLGGVLEYAVSAWDDCENVAFASIEAARPFLVKHQIIGKSMPRTRVPTDEELEALLNYYATPNKRGKKRMIRMAELIAFALSSTRRLGEITRVNRRPASHQQCLHQHHDRIRAIGDDPRGFAHEDAGGPRQDRCARRAHQAVPGMGADDERAHRGRVPTAA